MAASNATRATNKSACIKAAQTQRQREREGDSQRTREGELHKIIFVGDQKFKCH